MLAYRTSLGCPLFLGFTEDNFDTLWQSWTTLKRPKLNEQMRDDRIKELEDLADINSHITFKEQQRSQAEISRNYKLCDEIMAELMDCKSRKREIEKQLNILLQKDRRSKRRKEYMRKELSERRSTTPVSLLSSDSVCSEASTPTSRSNSTKSSGDNGRRQLELALMEHSNTQDRQGLQICTPATPEVHSLSSDEDTQSTSTVHPTYSPVEDEEELLNFFDAASSYGCMCGEAETFTYLSYTSFQKTCMQRSTEAGR